MDGIRRRGLTTLAVLAGALAFAPSANAAVSSVFTGMPSPAVSCDVQSGGATDGQTDAEDQRVPHGYEPYDYHLVNVPTPKPIVKGSLNLFFTHRFSEPLRPIRDTADSLLGLDSFAVPSFGLTYGITDRLYISAYRSPLCQRGLCRTIEIGLGYHILDEAGLADTSRGAGGHGSSGGHASL